MVASGGRRWRAAGRNWRDDHAGFIGDDATALIMLLTCKSILAALPNDPATLQQMLREVVTAAERQQTTLQATVQDYQAENDKRDPAWRRTPPEQLSQQPR